MRLYSGPLSMFGAKLEIAAREKGLAFELEMVPFDLQRGHALKHPEVLRVNPKGQVPVLVDGDVTVFDSTQIFDIAPFTENGRNISRPSDAETATRRLAYADETRDSARDDFRRLAKFLTIFSM